MRDTLNTNNLETLYIKEEIARCEDIDELKESILPMLKTLQEQWSVRIQEIVDASGYTKTKFAELCGVSRVSLDKWCKGAIPRNRETFLRIGMVANYDLEEMKRFLQRYGQYPGLYSKSLDDCICIFVINNYFGTEKIEKYNYILKKIKENIVRGETAGLEDISTEDFDEKLSDVKDEDALEQFIEENITIFATAYHGFYAYVKKYIDLNLMIEDIPISISEMADGQGWSSSLRQCVSAIRQKKWFPTRSKIISLGLHLSMDHEEVDRMLELAHMEPLCAKNPFESIIMFILDDASLNDMLDSDLEGFDQEALCRYAIDVLSEFEFQEAELFLSELLGVDNE